MSATAKVRDIKHEYSITRLRNTYGDVIPADWPLAPEGGWPDECGDGSDDVEYADLPDGSCIAVSCNTHHPRPDAP